MRRLLFHKMHGAGNDYVYVDTGHEKVEDPGKLAVKISDRHFGVGSDGLVLIEESETADFRMRMFNADGSEAGMCGNASRCVGKYVYELGRTEKTEILLETASGIKTLMLTTDENRVKEVCVDMGFPSLDASEIPVLFPQASTVPVNVDGQEFVLSCVSMGNPHAVLEVDDVENFDVNGIGKAIETHPLFPERCNVEFVEIVSRDHIRMRVWERGAGETMACGTGACASVVAAALNGRCARTATVILNGGEVRVRWDEHTDRVYLSGGAEWVFSGEYFVE